MCLLIFPILEQPRTKKPIESSQPADTISDKDKSQEEKGESKDVAPEEEAETKSEVTAKTEADAEVKSDEGAATEDKPEPIEVDESLPETTVESVESEEASVEAPVAEKEIEKPEEESTDNVEEEAAKETTSNEDAPAEAVAAPVVPRVIYDLLPDYVLIGQVDAEQLVAGPTRPATRQECEVIMLIGLPSCGKTTWAVNYAKEHEDKNYYLLSQATILERTTVWVSYIIFIICSFLHLQQNHLMLLVQRKGTFRTKIKELGALAQVLLANAGANVRVGPQATP